MARFRAFLMSLCVLCLASVLGCQGTSELEPNDSSAASGSGQARQVTQDNETNGTTSPHSNDTVVDSDPSASPEDPSTNEPGSIEFLPVDRAGLDEVIASHRGKVVLVDCWATWCHACMEEFPKSVALSNELGARGLVVIGLNFDSTDDPAQLAAASIFLRRVGARFPQCVNSVEGSVRSMEAYDIEEGLPHYRLYDRAGNLVATYSNQPDDLREQIERLLDVSE